MAYHTSYIIIIMCVLSSRTLTARSFVCVVVYVDRWHISFHTFLASEDELFPVHFGMLSSQLIRRRPRLLRPSTDMYYSIISFLLFIWYFLGECEANLVHELSDNCNECISEASISPLGNYVITRTANQDIPKGVAAWKELRHDILWDVYKQDVVYQVSVHVLYG